MESEYARAKKVYSWVIRNIRFKYYPGQQYSVEQVMKQKFANSTDMSLLIQELLQRQLITDTKIMDCTCYGHPHQQVHARLDGRNHIIDPCCRKQTTLLLREEDY